MLLAEIVKLIHNENLDAWHSRMVHVQFYWVDRNGKHHKVNNHGSYASTLSGKNPNDDAAYQFMYDRGWMKISIEDNLIYVTTSLTDRNTNISRPQREWLKMMRDEIYPHQKLQIVNVDGRPMDI